tara:strand:+ start:142 stop:456 length:315 start_codon:yes stop_codon:yes gene_type:complete
MIKIKSGPSGARMLGLHPEILLVVPVAHEILRQWEADLVITTGTDGTHMANSLHYAGYALDFRTRHLTSEQKEAFRRQLAAALGKHYDVVLHKSHLHVEFDHKG